jgi:hypothetical protein
MLVNNGAVFDSTDGSDGVCLGCHADESTNVACSNQKWMQHLTKGRVSESVWETVSEAQTGSLCGW